MKKQFLFLVMMLMPMAVMADEDGKCGDNVDFFYQESTHSLVIAGNGPMWDFTINGQPSMPWFKFHTSIETIIVQEGVTSIGDYAFYICEALKSITICDDVASIGTDILDGCKSLTSIVVEDENKVYDSREGCNAIIETSSNKLIAGCKTTVIPDGVKSIGDKAFSGCSGLTDINIPASVTSIGKGAFMNCSGLKSCTIPEGVTSIENETFEYCKALTTITIPSSVTSIGGTVFVDCNSLVNVYCLAESVPSTTSLTFAGFNLSKATLHVPNASINLYKAASPWKDFKKIEGLKCEKPTIKMAGGEMTVECDTEDVTFEWNYSFSSANAKSYGNKAALAGKTNCHVTVRATKEGSEDSEVAETDIELNIGVLGDTNGDGGVTITDAVSVVNIILNNSEAMVEETATFNFKEPLNLNLDPELDQSDKNLLNPNNADGGSLVNITEHTITTGPVVISFSKPLGTPGAHISRYGQGAPFCLEIGRLLSITFNLTGGCVLKSVNFDQDSDITLPSGQPGSWNYMTNTWTADDNSTTSVTLKNGDQSAKIYTIKIKYLRPSSLR